jgi:hypothetical protein
MSMKLHEPRLSFHHRAIQVQPSSNPKLHVRDVPFPKENLEHDLRKN